MPVRVPRNLRMVGSAPDSDPALGIPDGNHARNSYRAGLSLLLPQSVNFTVQLASHSRGRVGLPAVDGKPFSQAMYGVQIVKIGRYSVVCE